MSVKCLFGFHIPTIASIARKSDRHVALCGSCARPLEKLNGGTWRASDPLDAVPR